MFFVSWVVCAVVPVVVPEKPHLFLLLKSNQPQKTITKTKTYIKEKLVTVDVSAPTSMKNVAKCDT